ncbi:expressed unknown protein [Seminavis robusta]|uniref:Uncharacterized protein n=1 Tax=Seminavis robusta TaxID=568900 RepID=A0A9N8E032_9STRA|nr:expressed unknown protein [Seminavis robusta]|eukprot:Sro430_g141260.1 n/a (255) ;mRNA; f:8771-9617
MASTTADRKKQTATKDDDMEAKAMANDGDTTTNRERIEIASGRGVSDDGTDANHATSVRSSFAKKSLAGSHPVMAAMAENATAVNNRPDKVATETPPSLPGAYATPPTHYRPPRAREDSFLSSSLVAGIQELPSTPQQFRRPSSPGAYLDVPGLTLQRTPELNYEVMSQCSDNQSLPSAPHHEVDISSCADVTATELVEASVVSDNDDVSSQDLPAASLFDIEAAQRRQQKRETKSRFYYIMSLVLGCLVHRLY